jgi:hypothetical protein
MLANSYRLHRKGGFLGLRHGGRIEPETQWKCNKCEGVKNRNETNGTCNKCIHRPPEGSQGGLFIG